MTDSPRLQLFPAWRDNPYVNLMALASIADGYEADGCTQFSSLMSQLVKLRRGDVLHLHWTSPICQKALTHAEAAARIVTLRKGLTRARARGVRVVWTVHNAAPHEIRFPDLEIELMRMLAQVVDVVHIMNPGTAEMLLPDVELDQANIVHVPHPSFAGMYPPGLSRAEARSHFGIEDHQRAVLFLGQLRPYKGVSTLLDAFRLIPWEDRGAFALLIAGKAVDGYEREIESQLPEGVNVVFAPTFIDDAEISTWFAAADLMALPYERILNSGSAHLAATFGVPVLLPGERHVAEQFAREPWVHTYDTQSPSASIAAMLQRESTFEDHAEACLEFTTRLSPWRVSQRMRDEIIAVGAEARA